MSITILSSANFQNKGGVLHCMIPGIALVLFKMVDCNKCALLEPIFRNLAPLFPNINFATAELRSQRAIYSMSLGTTTEIKEVPQIYIYFNQKAFARFSGNRNSESIKDFIINMINQQSSFVQPHQQSQGYNNNRTTVGPNQNMYGGQQQTANNYSSNFSPDTQNFPSQIGKMANQPGAHQVATNVHPSMQRQCDPEDEHCLKTMENVLPYNKPWIDDINALATF